METINHKIYNEYLKTLKWREKKLSQLVQDFMEDEDPASQLKKLEGYISDIETNLKEIAWDNGVWDQYYESVTGQSEEDKISQLVQLIISNGISFSFDRES